MSEFISELIAIGGRSLEKEEEFLQSVSKRRGEVGGILTVKDDCFYQYVFGRGLLWTYKCQLRFNNDERCFAEFLVKIKRRKYFFVMEHWKSGEPLPPLKEDVDRLSEFSGAAYLLVFSASPYGQTEADLHRVDELAGAENRAGVHRFGAKDAKGEEYEFWIGCWQVARKRSAVP